MPPYFLYVMALFIYVVLACAVWLVAILLAIPQRTRTLAKKIAAGMAGSFPGVFLFQLIVAPLVVVILLLFFLIFSAFKPAGNWEGLCLIALFLGTVGLVGIASLVGFYTGWRLAWELAAGRSACTFLAQDRMLGPVVRFLSKRLPFLGKVLRY